MDFKYICFIISKLMLPQLLKSIIVDDEDPSREALVNYISEFCPDVEIVAECDSAQSAFKAINEHKPNLVFLDVEMPRGSGIDLLKMFKNISFKVIFVTAFSDYAVQAFRLSATDFLLKPVKVDELLEAISKARNEFYSAFTNQNLKVLYHNFSLDARFEKKLTIFNSHGFEYININDIIMCKADTYCTNFYIGPDKTISSSHNLKYYEELLPSDQFFRSHNSYILNINHIKGYNNQGIIKLSSDLSCPLSVKRKSKFLKIIKSTGLK